MVEGRLTCVSISVELVQLSNLCNPPIFLITFLATRGIIANIHSSLMKEPYIITWVNLPKKIRENAEPIFFY